MDSERREPKRRPGGAARASESTRSSRATSHSVKAPRPVDAAPDAPRQPGRTGVQRLVFALGCLFTVGVLLSACTLGYVNWRLGQITRLDLQLAKAAAGGPQNYLVVGSDTRAGITSTDPNSGAFLDSSQYSSDPNGGGARSDTIMIVRIDPSKKSAQLLSLPRDLYVPIAGTNHSDKINAAFGVSAKTLIQTVQDQFDIVINHYAEVDFVGFQKLIDAIGGVPMYFDKPVWDGHTGLNVPAVGCHTLNGTEALSFARSRYLWYNTGGAKSVDTSSLRYLSDRQMAANDWKFDGMSDLARISRQQLLIRTAIPLAEHKAFVNPATLNAVIGSVVSSVSLDKGLSTSDLLGLAERFKSFNAESLVTYAFPTKPSVINGADVLLPQKAKAEKILVKFRSGTPTPQSLVSVDVLNGSGVNERAANVSGALQRVGFQIADTGNSSTIGIESLDHTEVRFAHGDDAAAETLASHLTVPPKLVPDSTMVPGTIDLVVGADFGKVTSASRVKPARHATTTTPTSTTTTTIVGFVPKQIESC